MLPQDPLPPLPAQHVGFGRLGTEDWAMRSGTTLSANGGVHRRRQGGIGERLEPLRALPPHGRDLPPLSTGGKAAPGVLTTGSGLGGAAFLRTPLQRLLPVPSTASGSSSSQDCEGDGEPHREHFLVASGLQEFSSSSQGVNCTVDASMPASSAASANTSIGNGASGDASSNGAVRCQAVKSLQRLFFDEMSRTGDPNAAAAAALLRLAEETRPSEDAQRLEHES